MWFFKWLQELFTSANVDKDVLPSAEPKYKLGAAKGIFEGIRFASTKKHGGNIVGPRFIIIHYTANDSVEKTIRVFRNYSVSAHFIVGRDGTIVQMVNMLNQAWHAGKSVARSKWGTKHTGLNKYSIGIELVNYGYKGEHVPDNVDTSNWLSKRHKNGGPIRKWQPYSEAQVDATIDLVESIMKEYNIPIENVLGHDDISPTRKVDPGPAFPMNKLKSRLGERV